MNLNAQPERLITAEQLCWWPAGPAHSFTLRPGLNLVRGGEQRGKSSLLQMLAEQRTPLSGRLIKPLLSCWGEHALDPALDNITAQDWLAEQQARYPTWQPALAAALGEAFSLPEHLPKPFYMLSAGSRRKVGLLAAAACGADLVLLDTPYAALDMRSCRLLDELLSDAADSSAQIWVIADYALPAGLAGVEMAAVVDLGD
ncbi:ATP-binding cassette domain-containing protein [Ideonella sp.]|jgi:ATPase subunit of ABC transporter with duplicated ATPase domains|uniref:ATP-binding cassette domain-containing protein n=1 Tax=Ideonella sp. TaxID=1929293 RepID=UPI0037C00998